MEQVIIIGTGCAGWTAAIYSSRANLNPLVLAGSQPGGQLSTTTEVENFPGFPEGIQGPELMMQMQAQAMKFGTRVEYEQVTGLEQIGEGAEAHFVLSLESGEQKQAQAVIVATGARPRYLGIDREQELIGHGLTTCATCDGAFYRDVPVCVVGGGDSAAEEALFLTRFASKVYLIHRRDELRASDIMAERVLAHEKIEPIWNTEITEYLTSEEGKMRAVKLKNNQTGEQSELELACVFVAIGHEPNTGFLGDLVTLDGGDYIVQEPAGTASTKTAGLFAAGDCADHVYRQAITAAGEGCRAAIEAERYLAELPEAAAVAG